MNLFHFFHKNCFLCIELLDRKKVIDKKIKKIKVLLSQNLPKVKYMVLCLNLKNNIFISMFLYILWKVNKYTNIYKILFRRNLENS